MFKSFNQLISSSSISINILENIYRILGRDCIENILTSEKYANPLRLERFGFKVYSQNEEDGIIEEIFKRIGTLNQTFVEFGVQNGLENNTLYLLQKGWQGVWLEGDKEYFKQINKTFASYIKKASLKVQDTFVTRENIDSVLSTFSFPRELDLLCIDIDGNDYYVWDAIECVSPRLLVIEYNAKFPPPTQWVMDYNPHHIWDVSDYCGASLSSLTELAEKKGYSLVCCNIVGVNAFFVRKDLVANKFQTPFTAENYYQPARYYLREAIFAGHPSSGKFNNS
jgi:hypothetical protein